MDYFFSPRKFVLKNTSWVPSHGPKRVPAFDLSGFLNPGGPTSDWHLVENMRDGIPNYAPCAAMGGKRWQMDAPFEKTVIGILLGGGFKHFLFSSLFGEMIQFD